LREAISYQEELSIKQQSRLPLCYVTLDFGLALRH